MNSYLTESFITRFGRLPQDDEGIDTLAFIQKYVKKEILAENKKGR